MPTALLDLPENYELKEKSLNNKCILWVDANSTLNCVHNYFREEFYFYHTPLVEEAVLLINEGKLKIEAIIIGSSGNQVCDLVSIIEVANQKAIPLFLHTPVFDQKMKDLTIRLGIDDYHTGAFGHTFFKRFEFIKKIKEYKNHQGQGTNVSMYINALPKIGRWALKRTFDLFGSSVILIALSPIFAFIALIIKLGSKGPVFSFSTRVGMGYQIFKLWKFRTEAENDDQGATRFGEFLADSGLNELPSFINVLKGDMSLVGSRPLQVSEAGMLTRDQMAIRLMTPIGITGLWRIGVDKNISTQGRAMDLDMKYAMDNSFWMDVKILFFTFLALPLDHKV